MFVVQTPSLSLPSPNVEFLSNSFVDHKPSRSLQCITLPHNVTSIFVVNIQYYSLQFFEHCTSERTDRRFERLDWLQHSFFLSPPSFMLIQSPSTSNALSIENLVSYMLQGGWFLRVYDPVFNWRCHILESPQLFCKSQFFISFTRYVNQKTTSENECDRVATPNAKRIRPVELCMRNCAQVSHWLPSP